MLSLVTSLFFPYLEVIRFYYVEAILILVVKYTGRVLLSFCTYYFFLLQHWIDAHFPALFFVRFCLLPRASYLQGIS